MKKLFSYILLGLVGFSLAGQEMPSPGASGLIKAENVPVNQYNGVASVTVPIYEVPTPAGSLPIQLQYNTGGIKVAEEASVVGLGWNLLAGGSITRVIRDIPDEQGDAFDGIAASDLKKKVKHWKDNDGERDLFFFNYPGGSGKFVSSSWNLHAVVDGRSDCTATLANYESECSFPIESFVLLPHSEHMIEYFFYPDHSVWVITDPMGNKFYFGSDKEGINRSANYSEDSEYNSKKSTETYYKANNEIEATSTWHLSRIEYANVPKSRAIKFEYDESVYLVNETSSFLDRWEKGFLSWDQKGIKETNYLNKVTARYLTKIEFETGSVTFDYDSRYDSDAPKLTTINIRDHNGVSRNEISLEHSHFNATDSYNAGAAGAFDFKTHWRLKLDRIKSDGHIVREFDYTSNKEFENGYDIYELPPRNSHYYDHWGFYNGGSHHGQDYYPNAAATIGDENFGYQVVAGMDRDAHISAKAGMLSKVTLPTGSYTEFNYVPNSNHGGLRVDEIRNYDENGVLVAHQEYAYHDENSGPIPVYWSRSAKEGNYFDVYDNSKTHLLDLNGSFEGYERVVLTDMITGASSETRFMTISDNRPITARIKGKFNYDQDDDEIDFNTVSSQDGAPYITNSVEFYDRGLVKEVINKDAQGVMRQRQTSSYKLGDILYTIENTALEKQGEDKDRIWGTEAWTDWDIYFYSGQYTISTRAVQLGSTVTYAYEDGVELSTVTHYAYHNDYPSLQTSTITSHPDGSVSEQVTRYLIDAANEINHSVHRAREVGDLEHRNQLSVPFEQTQFLTLPGEAKNVIGATVTGYKHFNEDDEDEFFASTGSYSLLVKEPISDYETASLDDYIQYMDIDSRLEESASIMYDETDGRVISQTGKDGITKSYLYDTYGWVDTSISSTGENSRSSSYNYESLVGISSVTDTNNDQISYEYDDRNRLEVVRDNDDNIIKRYRYHSISDNGELVGSAILRDGINLVNSPLTFYTNNSITFYGSTNYTWDFGNGVTQQTSEPTITYSYPSTGSYQVTLTMENPEYGDPVTVSRSESIYSTIAPLNVLGPLEFDISQSNGGITGGYTDGNGNILFTANQGNNGAKCSTGGSQTKSWRYRIDGGSWVNLPDGVTGVISSSVFFNAASSVQVEGTLAVCNNGTISDIHTVDIVDGSGGGGPGGGDPPQIE